MNGRNVIGFLGPLSSSATEGGHYRRETSMKSKNTPDSVIIYSYPQFVFSWPLIVFGLLLAGLQQWAGLPENIAAWTYIAILGLVMVAMGVDLGRNSSIFCLVLFIGFWFFILWLQAAKNVMIFEDLKQFIKGLELEIRPVTMVVISILLGIIYLLMGIMAFFNDRWRITHNEIEHRTFGHKDVALGRGAKGVTASYPDALELLICLAGTLHVRSASGGKELLAIRNVPFLPLRHKKISLILETTSITPAMMEEEEEEEDA